MKPIGKCIWVIKFYSTNQIQWRQGERFNFPYTMVTKNKL